MDAENETENKAAETAKIPAPDAIDAADDDGNFEAEVAEAASRALASLGDTDDGAFVAMQSEAELDDAEDDQHDEA